MFVYGRVHFYVARPKKNFAISKRSLCSSAHATNLKRANCAKTNLSKLSFDIVSRDLCGITEEGESIKGGGGSP